MAPSPAAASLMTPISFSAQRCPCRAVNLAAAWTSTSRTVSSAAARSVLLVSPRAPSGAVCGGLPGWRREAVGPRSKAGGWHRRWVGRPAVAQVGGSLLGHRPPHVNRVVGLFSRGRTLRRKEDSMGVRGQAGRSPPPSHWGDCGHLREGVLSGQQGALLSSMARPRRLIHLREESLNESHGSGGGPRPPVPLCPAPTPRPPLHSQTDVHT